MSRGQVFALLVGLAIAAGFALALAGCSGAASATGLGLLLLPLAAVARYYIVMAPRKRAEFKARWDALAAAQKAPGESDGELRARVTIDGEPPEKFAEDLGEAAKKGWRR